MPKPYIDRDQKVAEEGQKFRGPRPSITPQELLASQYTEVHPNIVAERERRAYFHAKYQKELVQRTNTWEGFAEHLLSLRKTLEEHATTHMMQKWSRPQQEWPKIEAEELQRQMGPHPERPYEADRMWIIKRFLQLQRWGHGQFKSKNSKWHELQGQVWLLDLQREGEPFIKNILELKAFWFQQARRAWDALDVRDKATTEKNRSETILLLDQAFWAETYPEMQYGPRRWRDIRKERHRRYQRLAKLHEKAEKAVQHTIDTLEQYRTAVWETSNKPNPPLGHRFDTYLYQLYPPGMADKEGMNIEHTVAGLYTALSEIQKQIADLQDPLDLCFGVLLAEQKNPRGRRAKSALNASIVELYQKYSHLSVHKTIEHVHALLYVAGIWSRDNEQGFTAKFYGLRNQHVAVSPL